MSNINQNQDESSEPPKNPSKPEPPDTLRDVLSPDEAWPFPQGKSSPDEFADIRLIRLADTFAGESRRIRILQALVVGFGALVVASLLYFLCVAIDRGFNGHLKSTEQILVKVSSSLLIRPCKV